MHTNLFTRFTNWLRSTWIRFTLWLEALFAPEVEEQPDRDYEILDVLCVLGMKHITPPKHPVHLKEHVLLNFLTGMRDSLQDFQVAASGVRSLETQAEVLIEMVYQIKALACKAGLPWEELWEIHQTDLESWHGNDVILMPNTDKVLEAAGYCHRAFVNSDGEIVDAFCWDDRAIPDCDTLPSEVER